MSIEPGMSNLTTENAENPKRKGRLGTWVGEDRPFRKFHSLHCCTPISSQAAKN